MTPPLRVLLVDDDEDSRQLATFLLRTALAGLPHELLEADDGIEALEQCQRYDVTVLILDMHLRRLDGAAVLQSLADVSPRPRIIAWSADPAALEQAVLHGADVAIDKGRDVQCLTDAVSGYLRLAS